MAYARESRKKGLGCSLTLTEQVLKEIHEIYGQMLEENPRHEPSSCPSCLGLGIGQGEAWFGATRCWSGELLWKANGNPNDPGQAHLNRPSKRLDAEAFRFHLGQVDFPSTPF